MAVSKCRLMQQMRDRMLQLISEEKLNEFNPADLQAITSGSDDLLWRFALFDLECDSSVKDKTAIELVQVDRAVKSLLRTLKWRQEFGLHQFKDSDVPREFYLGKMFTYTLHREEKRFLVFIRVCKYKNISSRVRSLIIKCIVSEFEKLIRQFDREFENGICDLRPLVIIDHSDMKTDALDVLLLTETANILANHFPLAIDELWFYNSPWFFRPVLPLFMKSVHSVFARRCKQVSLADAIDSLGMSLLPEFMGGKCPIEPSLEIPQTSLLLERFPENNILNQDDIVKLKQHFKSVIKI